jgi:hypothetical protein
LDVVRRVGVPTGHAGVVRELQAARNSIGDHDTPCG